MLLLILALAVLSGKETFATNDSSCILNEINTRLGIAAQIIETARQKFPTDLRELCRDNFNFTCPEYKNRTRYAKPMDCSDIYLEGERRDGLYEIWPQNRMTNKPLQVYCDMESNGGGWTVIQRRGDYKSPQDHFYREWVSYKEGFGNMLKDFWMGNDNIFALTNQRLYHLRVNLTTWDGETGYAVYNKFWLTDEGQNYTLNVYDYSGTAGDSLNRHRGHQFSTKDRNNDRPTSSNCAEKHKGAWWYAGCRDSSLNGLYREKGNTNDDGISWYYFKHNYLPLKDSVMKIRPADFIDTNNRISTSNRIY